MEIGSVILLGGIFLVVIYRSGLSKEFTYKLYMSF